MAEGMYINAKITEGEKPNPQAPDFQAYFKKKKEFSNNVFMDDALLEQIKLDKNWVQFDAYLDFGDAVNDKGDSVNDLVRKIFQQYSGQVNIRFKPKWNKPTE